MTSLRPHTSDDYARLADMDSSDVGVLTARDDECLAAIGGFLIESGAHGRFGVTLLHSHFAVSDDEIMIERHDRDARVVSLRPEPRADQGALVALTARFEAGRDGAGLVGLEYAPRAAAEGVIAFSDDDRPVLQGLRTILDRHGAIDRFGIRVIHDPLGLGEDEVLLESCDLVRRTLASAAVSIDHPQFSTSIETFWSWQPTASGSESAAGQRCAKKCLKGCISTSNGHHSGPHDSWHDRI